MRLPSSSAATSSKLKMDGKKGSSKTANGDGTHQKNYCANDEAAVRSAACSFHVKVLHICYSSFFLLFFLKSGKRGKNTGICLKKMKNGKQD
jgi:hypothetical protein